MDIHIYGNPNGRSIVLLGGWPDTSDVFTHMFGSRFAADYRLVGLSFPGYATDGQQGPSSDDEDKKKKEESSKKIPFFGYSFDELVAFMYAAVEDAMKTDKSGQRPILVCHDWGATVSFEFLLQYPQYFARIVALDVSSHPFGEGGPWTVARFLLGRYASCSFKKALLITVYQWYLIAAYFAPRFIGDRMASFFAKISAWPRYHSHKTGKVGTVRGNMGWPYVQLWIGLLTRRPLITHKFMIPIYVPILYMYGTNKPFQFHSDAFIEHVKSKAEDGSKVVPVKGGHWFFARESTAGTHALGEIARFILDADKPNKN